MTARDERYYSYGPVPSRRLGKSLGIRNIPAKVCTYYCAYCQVGQTTQMQNNRRFFYAPEDILRDVQRRLTKARERAEQIDYLTFVPDGEPTLDANLGKEIMFLKGLGVPVGVISNGSLLWREDVREELSTADWVSLKVDAVEEVLWRQINGPHKALRLSLILDGMREFSKAFTGTLVTETMLVKGLNDEDVHMKEIADFIDSLQPSRAYLSVPIRPPTKKWVRRPDEEDVARMYQIIAKRVKEVECLTGYEGDAFAFTGDIEKDLLSITAVHPMRKEAVSMLLSRACLSWEVVDRLVSQGDVAEVQYDGHTFYLRRFARDYEVTT